MRKKYKLFSILPLAALLLAGCTLIPFENPEDQRRKAEAAATQPPVELADPWEALEPDRVYTRELRNQVGTLLAVYEARMPLFSQEGIHGESFGEINRHFDVEFEQCPDECDSFFEMVKRYYGVEWELLESVPGVFSTHYFYTLLPAPEKYISIQKTYIYKSDKGTGHTSFFPDVFLAENGWRLSFEGLFGHNTAEAEALVMTGIGQWCDQAQVPHEKLDTLTAQDFTDYYAMDDTSLIFYAPPFLLSTNDGTAYTIPLDIARFRRLLIE